MFRYFLIGLIFLTNLAEANTPFQGIQWRLQPGAFTYVAVMPGAQETSTEYLGDGNLGRSNIYLENAAYHNIKVPSIHAYHPKTCQMAAIELDPALRALLPANLPIPEAEVTRLFISVELLDTEALRFRPHRFVDRNCPTYAQNPQYNYAPQIQAGLFGLDGQHIPFTDIAPPAGQILAPAGISIHAAAPVPAQGLAGTQILSPDNMHIPAVQNEPSRGYYSIVAHKDDKSRVAVTLHWLISERDANEMWRLLRGARTIEDFRYFVDQTCFKNTAAALEVKKLIPAQAALRLHAVADNDDDDAVTEALMLSQALYDTAGRGDSSSSTSTTTRNDDAGLAEALALSAAMQASRPQQAASQLSQEELELQLMLALSAAGEAASRDQDQ